MEKNLNRRLFLSTLAVGTGLGISACGSEEIKRTTPTPIKETSATIKDSSDTDPRRWVLYGDSFTASGYIAQALEGITGYKHVSAGASGDTTSSAAFRSGAKTLNVKFENNSIPAEGKVKVVEMDFEINPVAANYWHYPCIISGVSGYLMREFNSAETYFYLDGPGEQVEVDGWIPVVIDPDGKVGVLREGIENKYSMIIGLGRNDVDNQISSDETLRNIQSILDTIEGENKRFLVWDVPPWASESLETEARKKIGELNGLLSEKFGDRFVQPIKWIIEDPEAAFKAAKVPFTAQDKTDIESGVIPESFKNDDMGHLNQAGARAWAHFMFQEIKKRGW